MYLYEIQWTLQRVCVHNEDGIVTELKSRDATFWEDDFPCTGEIDRDLHIYEMMDPNIGSILK